MANAATVTGSLDRRMQATSGARADSRMVRVLVMLLVVATAFMFDIAASVSRVTGIRETAVVAMVHAPLVLLAVRLRGAWDPLLLAAALLVALMGASLAWSEIDVVWYGITAVFAAVTMLAWAVVFMTWPSAVRWCASALQVVVVLTAVLWSVDWLLELDWRPTIPTYTVLIVALFTHVLANRGRKSGRALWHWFYYMLCFSLILGSDYRAAAIGAAAGVVFASVRGRLPLRLTAAVLIAASVLAIPFVATRRLTAADAPRRDDLLGRYAAVPVDRFSGRLDIWIPVLEEVSTLPRWLWAGFGVGDVETNLFMLTNWPWSAQGSDGLWRTHSHNVVLEVVLATGVVGLVVLAMFTLRLWRYLRVARDPVLWGLWATVVVIAMANVPAYDLYGGTLLGGLAIGATIRRVRTRPGTQLADRLAATSA